MMVLLLSLESNAPLFAGLPSNTRFNCCNFKLGQNIKDQNIRIIFLKLETQELNLTHLEGSHLEYDGNYFRPKPSREYVDFQDISPK